MIEHVFVYSPSMATVPEHELIALSRSAAMMPAGSQFPVDRELLIATFEELLELRRLLRRLGGDIRTVVRGSSD